MRRFHTAGFMLAATLAALVFVPGARVEAATYYYPTYSTYYSSYSTQSAIERLQALIAQLRELERQLADIRGGNTTCGYRGNCSSSYGRTDVSRVDVELFDDYADVTIRYRDGDRDELLFDADTRAEVIDYLVDETKNSRPHLLAVTRFEDGHDTHDDDIDDIRRIDVDIRNGNAYVEVRFEDGERDTFTIFNETDEDEISEEIADELDIDEDDVEDLVEWEDDSDEDVRDIDVTIYEDDEEARARVYYDDGSADTFSYDTDDEDDIIEELADDLDMDEEDVEDVVDFKYED